MLQMGYRDFRILLFALYSGLKLLVILLVVV